MTNREEMWYISLPPPIYYIFAVKTSFLIIIFDHFTRFKYGFHILILFLFYSLINFDINLTRDERWKRQIPDTFKLTTFVTLKKIRIKNWNVCYILHCFNIIYLLHYNTYKDFFNLCTNNRESSHFLFDFILTYFYI